MKILYTSWALWFVCLIVIIAGWVTDHRGPVQIIGAAGMLLISGFNLGFAFSAELFRKTQQ
jgi:hypothetical protein